MFEITWSPYLCYTSAVRSICSIFPWQPIHWPPSRGKCDLCYSCTVAIQLPKRPTTLWHTTAVVQLPASKASYPWLSLCVVLLTGGLWSACTRNRAWPKNYNRPTVEINGLKAAVNIYAVPNGRLPRWEWEAERSKPGSSFLRVIAMKMTSSLASMLYKASRLWFVRRHRWMQWKLTWLICRGPPGRFRFRAVVVECSEQLKTTVASYSCYSSIIFLYFLQYVSTRSRSHNIVTELSDSISN